MLPRSSPSATAARDGVQTEADIVDIIDIPEIDRTANDEGSGRFLLCVVVRPVDRDRRIATITIAAVMQGGVVHMRYGR